METITQAELESMKLRYERRRIYFSDVDNFVESVFEDFPTLIAAAEESQTLRDRVKELEDLIKESDDALSGAYYEGRLSPSNREPFKKAVDAWRTKRDRLVPDRFNSIPV